MYKRTEETPASKPRQLNAILFHQMSPLNRLSFQWRLIELIRLDGLIRVMVGFIWLYQAELNCFGYYSLGVLIDSDKLIWWKLSKQQLLIQPILSVDLKKEMGKVYGLMIIIHPNDIQLLSLIALSISSIDKSNSSWCNDYSISDNTVTESNIIHLSSIYHSLFNSLPKR